jgi:hypothetical protein
VFKGIAVADETAAPLALDNPARNDRLVVAMIALCWSEAGAAARLRKEPNAEALYEAWPEMDDLMAALDEARPEWRMEASVRPVPADFVSAEHSVGQR